jgi:hypothetical protein
MKPKVNIVPSTDGVFIVTVDCRTYKCILTDMVEHCLAGSSRLSLELQLSGWEDE